MAKKKGIKIGNYRIMPLGIAVVAVLVIAIAALGVTLVLRSRSETAKDPSSSSIEPVFDVGDMDNPTVEPSQEPEISPTPTVEPTPTPEPTPLIRSATIRTIGEIGIQTNILNAARVTQTGEDGTEEITYDFSPMFEYIEDVVGDADWTVADVEGPMGGEGETGYTGDGLLNTPPQLMQALKDAGVDMLTLANDHALDTYFDGLIGTMKNASAYGLDYIGAAQSQAEHDKAQVRDINGIQVGFLNYTTDAGANAKNSSTDALTYGLNVISEDFVQDIQALKDAGAEVIVCYVSWGKMGERTANSEQETVLTYLAKAGVDVIIGYNPHTAQTAVASEITLEDGSSHYVVALGATGVFLSDFHTQYYDSGMIFEFTIQEKQEGGFEITNLQYIPTYVWREQTAEGYQYRVLAVGEWLEERPEGMSDAEYERMQQVWTEIQQVMDAGKSGAQRSAS